MFRFLIINLLLTFPACAPFACVLSGARAALPSQSVSAVGAGIELDSYEWDFGRIMERDGVVTHTFVLTNTGTRDFMITNAVPSCSCTYVTFTKNMIAPGGKGEIEVRFSPSGAVGKVMREVELYDKDNRPFATLQISAEVEPNDRAITERYPIALGEMLYSSLNRVPFGYVFHGEEKSRTIYIANASTEPMHISIETSGRMLRVDYPDTLQGGEEAEMRLTYSTPNDSNLFAAMTDTIRITANGKRAANPIITTMTALAPFHETANSPRLRTYPSAPLLRKKGKEYVAVLELHNDGNGDLTINAVQLPAFATCDIEKGDRIAAGKQRKVVIRSAEKREFTIHLFSNDPLRPIAPLTTRSPLTPKGGIFN